MVDHNNIERHCEYHENGLMMSWSSTEGLDNAYDQMTRMIVWSSTESHDNTKVKLIGLIDW